MKRIALILIAFLAVANAEALAMTLTGNVRYENRNYDRNGFTNTTLLPARFAKVTVTVGGGLEVVTGATDGNGDYSVTVSNNGVRNIEVAVSTENPDSQVNGQLRVHNSANATYMASVTDTNVDTSQANHTIDFDVLLADPGEAAEAFNLFDCVNDGNQLVDALEGSFGPLLRVQWTQGSSDGTYFDPGTNIIHMLGTNADPDQFDDAVILHEMGHYVSNNFSVDDNPGGPHSVTQNNQNVFLAYSEGYASFFSGATRSFRGDAQSDAADYIDNTFTDAGYFNIEGFGSDQGDLTNVAQEIDAELNVAGALWDLFDVDPGDDDPLDTFADNVTVNLGMGANGVNDVMDYMWDTFNVWMPAEEPNLVSPVGVSLEFFFLGYFDNAANYNGTLPSVVDIFQARGMNYEEDNAEPDNNIGAAPLVQTDGTVYNRTFFDDAGTGVNTTVDLFRFAAVQGASYTVETSNLANLADTKIYITPDGTSGSAVATNADISGSSNVASRITDWENTLGNTDLYVRVEREQSGSVFRNQARSQLGHYSLSVTQTEGPESPIVNLFVNDDNGTAPHQVILTLSAFSPDFNQIILAEVDFDGDGVYEIAQIGATLFSHIYTLPGTYDLAVRITDNQGLFTVATHEIEVAAPDVDYSITFTVNPPVPTTQSVDQVPMMVQVNNLPAEAEVLSYAFDINGDGIIDIVELTDDTDFTATPRYTVLDDGNLGDDELFAARTIVTFNDDGEIVQLTDTANVTVDANASMPDITLFEADHPDFGTDLVGVLPLEVTFTAETTFTAMGNDFQYMIDVNGDGIFDLFSPVMVTAAGANQWQTDYTYNFQGNFRPVLRVVDLDFNGGVGLGAQRALTTTDTVINVLIEDVFAMTFNIINPLEDGDVSGVITLLADVLSLDGIQSARFQYSEAGENDWVDVPGLPIVTGKRIKQLFDTGDLAPDLYDFSLLINNDEDARDDFMVEDVSVVAPPANSANLNLVPAAVTEVGFLNGNEYEYYAETTDGTVAGEFKSQVVAPDGSAVILANDFTDGANGQGEVTVRIESLGLVNPGPNPTDNGVSLFNAALVHDFSILTGEIHEQGAEVDLTRPITIRIAWRDGDFDSRPDSNEKVLERNLRFFYFNAVTEEWEEMPGTIVNEQQNWAQVETTHLSMFGLFAVGSPIPPFLGGGSANPCFIATAAYGSPMEPQVDLLRDFRDEVLKKNEFGENLVDTYYRVSPPVADYISERPILKAFARHFLRPITDEIAEKKGQAETTAAPSDGK